MPSPAELAWLIPVLPLAGACLVGLGLIPPLFPILRDWLAAALTDPLLESSLYAWLGWSSGEVLDAVVGPLRNLSSTAQEMILMLAEVYLLGMFLSFVLILYASWAICWGKTARPEA